MAHLFLDIETVPDFTNEEYLEAKERIDSGKLNKDSSDKGLYWKFCNGGLGPFDGKVVLITYQIDDGAVCRLEEWKDGEESILKKFFQLLQKLGKDGLEIVGHNVLGFDLPFLYERMKRHTVGDEKWIYHYLIKKPVAVDFLQLHLPLNYMRRSGLKYDVLAEAYGFLLKEDNGSSIAEHYYKRDYDRIMEYSERKFTYPKLYDRIRKKGLVSTKELKGQRIKTFLSYHTEDKEKAKTVKTELEKAGIGCFLAPYDIPAGTKFREVLFKEIKSCNAFIPLISENYHTSGYSDQELGIALGIGKPVIPLCIDSTSPYGFIEGYQCVCSNDGDIASAIPKLAKSISEFTPSSIEKYADLRIKNLSEASSFASAAYWARQLENVSEFTNEQLQKITDVLHTNDQVSGSWIAAPILGNILRNEPE